MDSGQGQGCPSTSLKVKDSHNRVRVFCNCPRPGEYDGVEYLDLADFPKFVESGECDVFIASRFLDGLAAPVRSRVNVLWNHDVLVEEAAGMINSLMYKIDALFCISEFQREQYRQMLDIPAERFVLTRNGVDLDLIEECTKGVGREPERLIYTSRPERGLRVLLEMWPRLKARRPGLKLGVAWYENAGADAQMKQLIGTLKCEISKLEGVELLGALNKRGLYREMARAGVWVYPGTFPEVSCISAMEAAGCGTPAVASKYCALKETIAEGESGLLIPGVPGSEEYAEAFEDAVVSLIEDREKWERLNAEGRARITQSYQWRLIAEEWQKWIEGRLCVSESLRLCVRNQKRISSMAESSYRSDNSDCSDYSDHSDNSNNLLSEKSVLKNGGRETVSCCMIVKDAEGTLHRCLKSVRPWVDELIVCDTGSKDSTREIARQYADGVKEIDWTDDFGEARNRSMEGAKGDWILWIDADEYLVGGEHLEKYLRANMYNGYVIRQHHQALDADFKPDVPVRLFRNNRGIKFYGVIHEHPEEALNEGIRPAVILSDVHIVHDGYITEKVRRERFLRNLPMLLKDREKYPQRRLGLVFLARDYIHLARYEMERNKGRLEERGRRFLEKAAAIHREHFADQNNPLYVYSFPLYQTALALLDRGIEVAWYVGPAEARAGGIRRCRVESEEELRGMMEARVRGMFRKPEEGFAFER